MNKKNTILIEVIRNSFKSIAQQMNNNLARSAYTPIIYEMKDCSVAIFDKDINLLGESAGLPVFLGTLGPAVMAITDKYKTESMKKGDIYIINDSYIVGSHLNDMTVVAPVFMKNLLVGFCATKAHWMDIGAKSPSSATDSTDIYQEGYRIGPTKIYDKFKPNNEVLNILTDNSRMPKAVWGDLHAQISACRIGESELEKLYIKYGYDLVTSINEIIFNKTEELETKAISRLNEGTWCSEGHLDSWGPGGDPVKVKTTITVKDGKITVSLKDSSPQTPGCLNCGKQQTIAGIRLAYKFIIEPSEPVNAGSFKNLEIDIPDNSVFNAKLPAACQHYYPHIGLMIDLFMKSISNATLDYIIAGQPGDAMNIMFTGNHPDTGELFVSGEATGVGWGAHKGSNGENGMMTYGGGDLKNFPVEVQEFKFPLLIHEYSLRKGSGGKGKWNGGMGLKRKYELLSDAKLSTWFERTKTPGEGLQGGSNGLPGDVIVNYENKNWKALKCANVPLKKGTQVTIKTGGGGGFGQPQKK